jgi:hypothetical protein
MQDDADSDEKAAEPEGEQVSPPPVHEYQLVEQFLMVPDSRPVPPGHDGKSRGRALFLPALQNR